MNNRLCPVLGADGSVTQVRWRDLQVGQIIKVVNRGEVPADVIVLQTSEPKGVCYVETSQIDGETNLKLKEALGTTATSCDSDAQLGALGGDIVYDQPNDRIHHFTGKLRSTPDGAYAPVGAKSMVLRGCALRNTRWMVGLVVYTGRETKVMKKSSGARSKVSRVEQTMNTCIKIVFLAQAVLCSLADIALAVWKARHVGETPYLREDAVAWLIPDWLGQWFTFLLLFNNFIPISLYITVEMVNYAQAFLIDVDAAMYCDECNTPAKARTSNLNQDLGQIEYVFSDKTGTLTRNVMEFKQCAIGGRVYGTFEAEADAEEEEEEAHTAAAATAPDAARRAAGGSTPNLLEALHAAWAGVWCPRRGSQGARPSSAKRQQVLRSSVDDSPPAARGSLASGGAGVSGAFGGINPISWRGGATRAAAPHAPVADPEAAGGGGSPRGPHSARDASPRGGTNSPRGGEAAAHKPGAGGGGSTSSGFDDVLLVDALSRAAAASGLQPAGPEADAPPAPVAHSAAELEPSSAPLSAGDVAAAEAFFTCMAVCHTVVPETEPGSATITYQAESPDEAALTKAAKDAGFEFVVREADHIVVRRHGARGLFRDLRYDVFGVHDFNSTRKRMSLVTQDASTGRIWLMCKGADNVMFDRAITEPSRPLLERQLTAFASKGLRTLVLGWREMSVGEFQAWRAEHGAASVSLTGREEALAAVAERYETGFTVLGATAIEDRLQAGVPGTIRDLARAGIKTWVLTGDKVETAINIGFSCRLLEPRMELITLSSEDPAALRAQLAGLEARFRPLVPALARAGAGWAARALAACGLGGGGGAAATPVAKLSAAGVPAAASPYRGPSDLPRVRESTALVLTGPCLTHVLDQPDLEDALLTVARCCRAVIACRVSPQQKATIVHLVRRRVSPAPMTLAIGDGANDVGMIQRAEVGVGISGKEGLQAVNSADFAIAQFRFLRRLLLVHGRWNYRRMTKVVLYSFYKNVVITLSLFYYTSLTGFSGTSFYESLVYSAYNFVLGLPIIFIGITERDLPATAALAHPAVYAQGREGLDLNPRRMLVWLGQAVLHSAVVFWLPYGVYGADDVGTSPSGAAGGGGGATGQAAAGILTFSCLVWGMTLKVAFETLSWTYLNTLMVALSMLGFYAFILVYQSFSSFSPEFYGVASEALGRSSYWLTLALVLGIMVALELVLQLLVSQFAPAPVDIARELCAGLGEGAGRDFATGRPKWGDEEPTHAERLAAAAAAAAAAAGGADASAAAADKPSGGGSAVPTPPQQPRAVSPPGERQLSATALAAAASTVRTISVASSPLSADGGAPQPNAFTPRPVNA